MATKTERLRAGLLALGYTPIASRSSRECFTKPATGLKPDGSRVETTAYVWLMTGSLRLSLGDERFGEARGASTTFIDKVLAAAPQRAPRPMHVDFF